MIQLSFFLFTDGLANGIGRAANAMDRMLTMVILIVIAIDLVFLGMTFWFKNMGSKIALCFSSTIMVLLAILCLQHEVGFYTAGVILLIIALIGFIRVFMKK